jgi:hypothetical protein
LNDLSKKLISIKLDDMEGIILCLVLSRNLLLSNQWRFLLVGRRRVRVVVPRSAGLGRRQLNGHVPFVDDEKAHPVSNVDGIAAAAAHPNLEKMGELFKQKIK